MKKNFLSCLLSVCSLLLCCNCVSCKKPCKALSTPLTKTELHILIDDSVKALLGDSISRIIFEADTTELFSLSVHIPADSLGKDSNQTDKITPISFHGCYIKHNYGMLTLSEVNPILHILSDRENYLSDELRLKSPFTPVAALSFKKDGSCIDMVFSFNGGQMYIFMENEEKLYFKYTYERLIMRFFQYYLKDELITEYLNL